MAWPIPGSSFGTWATDLINTLLVGHDADGGHTIGYVDRGDPATDDLVESSGNFSDVDDTNNAWVEFDLNAIAGVPVLARAVLIKMAVHDGNAGSRIYIRDSANSNQSNRTDIRTQVANITAAADIVVSLTDGKIDIRAVNLKFSDFTEILLSVKGWWL